MSVENILSEKGRNTFTVSGDRTLREAIQMLNQHRIGALVVVDESGAVQGILSERDVVQSIAENGAGSLDDSVSRRMTRNVVTCAANASIADLMGLMTTNKFRHVPVVEHGRLGGMVSIGDIVKHRLAEMEAEHKALRDYIATA